MLGRKFILILGSIKFMESSSGLIDTGCASFCVSGHEELKPKLMSTSRHSMTFSLAVFLILFFFSCGSLNSEKSLENKISNSNDNTEISALRSEVADLKDSQAGIKYAIKKRDILIQRLQEQIKMLENSILSVPNKQIKNMAPDDLYQKARNYLLEEKFLAAVNLFKEFIKKFSDNDLADNAAYWLGECYSSLGKYQKAITVFKNLAEKYPKSEKIPGAILKTGYAYLALNDSNRA
ncbi:tetratricopeptide repeat protein, partial [bacterium]|nr:tetratricopeptide repeat protein [bacterium]